VAPRQSMTSGGLLAAESIATNVDTCATHHTSIIAAAANRNCRRTVLAAAIARLTTTDEDVTNRRTHQTVTTASTSISADHLSPSNAAAITIGTRTPSRSVYNNNQPSWAPRPYMYDLPVDIERSINRVHKVKATMKKKIRQND
jgi:hypothetical protein